MILMGKSTISIYFDWAIFSSSGHRTHAVFLDPSHHATLLLPVAGLDPCLALAEPWHGGLRIEPWTIGWTLGGS